MVKNQWRADDEPGPRGPVAALLRAAAAPTEAGPQPGEALALAAFRATEHTKRRIPMRSLTPVKAALAAAVSGGVLLTGGVAAAATGTLPGAAQDTARTWLAQVGVSVPGADDHSAGHADQRGPATTDTTDSTDTTGDAGTTDASTDQGDTQEPTDTQEGKGAAVSDLARNTDATGVAKGAEISGLASDGKSKAGQHGKATEQPSRTDGQAHKPTTAPEPAPGTDDGSDAAGGSSGDAGGSSGGGHRP